MSRHRYWRLFAVSFCLSGLVTSVAAVTNGAISSATKEAYRRPRDIPFPPDNPYTPEKAALGKALYFDPRLSGNQNMTCATCHNPSFGWEVPVKTPIGAQGTPLARQSPTVLNQAWVHPYFWDGRAKSLEEQAQGPIQNPMEMNLSLDDLVKRISAVGTYRDLFQKVFPDQPNVTADNIARAIATFERTVVASYAPFDGWLDGDEAAISDSARRGFDLFNGKAQCADCHAGWNFTDNKFHDIGTTSTDIGRGKYEPDNVKAQYAFKTPSLRDTGQRAPYMHDGSMATLEDVVTHYLSGGIDRPSRSDQMRPVSLDPAEIEDIIAFLKSLTGSRQVVALPVLPN